MNLTVNTPTSLPISAVNSSTKGGLPWAAVLTAEVQVIINGTKVFDTSQAYSFAAGEQYEFSFTLNIATPGTGTITALILAPDGTVLDTISEAVTVVAVAPVADFTMGLTVQFTDTSQNTPTSWSWDFGDGTTSTAQDPVHSYASPGIYTITLTVANISGNSTVTHTITVQ